MSLQRGFTQKTKFAIQTRMIYFLLSLRTKGDIQKELLFFPSYNKSEKEIAYSCTKYYTIHVVIMHFLVKQNVSFNLAEN